MRFQTIALQLLLFTAGAQADTLLRIKMRLESTPPQPLTVKSPVEAEMQLWVGDRRLREDSSNTPVSVIRRFDLRKLYLVDPRTRTYAEMDLPSNPARSAAGGAGDATTVTVTDEVRRIGSWNARKVIVVSRGSMGGETSTIKWMSEEVGVDEGTLNRWQTPGSQSQLGAVPGYPVLEETRSSLGQGETEFRWHKELVSVESKEPPAGLYDPPAGYTKVKPEQIKLTPDDRPAEQ